MSGKGIGHDIVTDNKSGVQSLRFFVSISSFRFYSKHLMTYIKLTVPVIDNAFYRCYTIYIVIPKGSSLFYSNQHPSEMAGYCTRMFGKQDLRQFR